MKTLIRNAHVLTLDAEDREHPRADILVEGATISVIGADLPAPPDAKVCVASSGLVPIPRPVEMS